MDYSSKAKFSDTFKSLLLPKIPDDLKANFKYPGEKRIKEFEKSLRRYYYHDVSESFFETEKGARDLRAHLTGRLKNNRRKYIPWLNSIRPISGMNILEIGCGTGASTVALAEQGANVTGLDIVEDSLEVAKKRCDIFGVDANLLAGSSTEVSEKFSNVQFDLIIFYASLEHMTHQERMVSMRDTWNMLAKGGLWCVVETPNRIWYFDSHTSRLPFFNWLPDELAFKYSSFSPKPHFNEAYRDVNNNEEFIDFLRKGRGVSYHEFEVCMSSLDKLKVLSSISEFERKASILRRLKWRYSLNYKYESFLSRVVPENLHEGFLQPYLDLILAKS